MENKKNQVMMVKEKLEFLDIIKESLKLIPRNPNFIILTFFTSLPLFCFLLFLEIILQQFFIQILELLTGDLPWERTGVYYTSPWQPIYIINKLIQDLSLLFLLSSALFLGIGHLLDLFNTITAVHSMSMIYTEQEMGNNFKVILSRAFEKVGFKGPLITSIYSLILSSLTWIGFISLSMHFCMSINIFKALFVLAIIALLIKYLEWSAIWNLGMVISILEEKHGDVAIGVSAYISRGSRKRGFLLMLVFFVWKVGLRLMGFYGVWAKKRSLVFVTIGQICLVCLGNLVKWVVFTVYFYDCKKRFLEKKVDVEQGRAAEMVKL